MNKSITFLLSLFLGIIILSSFVSSSFKEGLKCKGGVVTIIEEGGSCLKNNNCQKCRDGLGCGRAGKCRKY
jgi:preprotein translocase subunit SecF